MQPRRRRLLRLPSRLGAAAPRGGWRGAPGPVLGAAVAERRSALAGHAAATTRPRRARRCSSSAAAWRSRASSPRARARTCWPPTAPPTRSPSPPTCSPQRGRGRGRPRRLGRARRPARRARPVGPRPGRRRPLHARERQRSFTPLPPPRRAHRRADPGRPESQGSAGFSGRGAGHVRTGERARTRRLAAHADAPTRLDGEAAGHIKKWRGPFPTTRERRRSPDSPETGRPPLPTRARPAIQTRAATSCCAASRCCSAWPPSSHFSPGG